MTDPGGRGDGAAEQQPPAPGGASEGGVPNQEAGAEGDPLDELMDADFDLGPDPEVGCLGDVTSGRLAGAKTQSPVEARFTVPRPSHERLVSECRRRLLGIPSQFTARNLPSAKRAVQTVELQQKLAAALAEAAERNAELAALRAAAAQAAQAAAPAVPAAAPAAPAVAPVAPVAAAPAVPAAGGQQGADWPALNLEVDLLEQSAAIVRQQSKANDRQGCCRQPVRWPVRTKAWVTAAQPGMQQARLYGLRLASCGWSIAISLCCGTRRRQAIRPMQSARRSAGGRRSMLELLVALAALATSGRGMMALMVHRCALLRLGLLGLLPMGAKLGLRPKP